MEYLKIDGEFPRLSKSAVTLGKFDGIHRGHRKLVERILEQKEKGLQTVLFSLGIGSQMIFTKEERCRILEDAGVDVLIECPLDARIRHMKADTFIKEILVGDLQAEHVAVGEDFRFGYERKGNPELLREMGKKLGFSVDVIPKEMEGKRKISSTFIREELKRGNMEKVNEYCSRNGYPLMEMGIALHRGEAFIGNVGSEQLMRYNVIGSVVNECSRIESFSVGSQILASQECLAHVRVPVDASAYQEIQAKGLAYPISVCEIRAIRGSYDCRIREQKNDIMYPVDTRVVFNMYPIEVLSLIHI